jgi:hypothetical protein
MTKNDKKYFDCIAMKSNIQKQIYDETKNMTINELLRYFNGNGKSTKAPIAKMPNAALNVLPD